MPIYEGFNVTASDREGKKYKAVAEDGTEVHFGASGYRIKVGTDAGNNYCARSSGIPSPRGSANWWARQLWSCEGKRSVSDKPFFGKIDLP
jgi:hypothetical protein